MLSLIALEYKTTEKVKATDADWIVYMTNAKDSLQRDSIGQIVTKRVAESIAASEHRELARAESLSIVLRLVASDSSQAAIDSARTVLTNAKAYTDANSGDPGPAIHDSLGQPLVIIPQSMKVKGVLYGQSGAYWENPTADSSNYVEAYHNFFGAINNYGNLYTRQIALPNSATISSTHADSLQFTETAFKFNGNQLLKGTFEILNGTATTFTQAPNGLTISGDSLSLRIMTNINPWPTSPQTSTFLSKNAGKVGCTGANNIVIGYQSGDALTSGAGNTFVGSLSGGAVAAAANNTFMGYSAGAKNTANANSFFGQNAGAENTTGARNTFMGYASGLFNIATGGNTYIGYQAGWKQKSNGNTFVGNYAGSQYASYATGSNNDCFGDSTGVGLTTGKNNKFIGAYSGLNITTGNRNLIWGDFKGGISPDSLCVIDNTGKDSTGAAFTLNMTAGVANRGLTVDGKIISNGSYNYGGAEAGGDDDYVVAVTGLTLKAGIIVTFLATDDNAGSCTLNLNALGAVAIKDQKGDDPLDAYIDANSFVMVGYDGTNFVLLTPDANP